ncbi:hypothetical protein KAU33_11560 [Candidatus Dependentiae bacterium]|nr:hypothetical protein [Candidatus Dependentiae bacterium]
MDRFIIYYINGIITVWIFTKAYYFQVVSILGCVILIIQELLLIKEKTSFKKKVSYV